jgi:tripartite-type tricarboxylate transporter receptor subunit TctC
MRAYLMAITLATTVAALIGIEATIVHAQTFVSRPVKTITDVGIGGTYDIFARALGEELHKKWGQPVIVEPHPGSNGFIGARACAEASPDGHVFCVLSNQWLVANEFLYKTLPYSRASFSPVTNLFYNTQVIVVSTSLGVRTLDELAALAKSRPGTLNYSVPGIFQRVFFDNFNKRHGIDLVAIPFKGGGDVLTGVLSGSIPIGFIGGANFAPYVREGKMVALGVDAPTRSPLFPDAPTLDEIGYSDPMIRSYLALMVPAGTPAPIIARLHADVAAIMKEPGFRQRQVIDRGLEPVLDPPDAFARFLETDCALTGALVKAVGVEAQ